jgi:voltage-gated potassium channel
MAINDSPSAPWRRALHEIIFEADTPLGKVFDIALMIFIVLSVIAALLESVTEIRASHGMLLITLEWIFTILFTIEYVLRLACVGRPMRYALSFFGIVDLLSILPTYLSLIIAGTQSLIVIRALRLLRVFRVLKLARFVGEARMLQTAIKASLRKILIFMETVVTLVVIIGALMYLIEGTEEETGFTSIPQSIYWAIVTLTTVGYGDIAPITVPGKALASLVMILGYSILAVPTGIVTVEMANVRKARITTQSCPECAAEGHDADAKHCKFCGAPL